MPERITSAQIDRIRQHVGEAVSGLTKDGAQRLISQGGAFFVLLSDAEVHEWLCRHAGKDEAGAKRLISGYRRGTSEHEIPEVEPCHVLVQPEATFKGTIPQFGPCVHDFKYLQDWNFPDPPTQECLLSLIPMLLPGSIRKNVAEQRELLAQVRQRLELPEHHLAGFGAVTHLAGAALAYKAAGRDIFDGKWARTETCCADSCRLDLFWGVGGLGCDRWDWDDERRGLVGVLACGVEKALGH